MVHMNGSFYPKRTCLRDIFQLYTLTFPSLLCCTMQANGMTALAWAAYNGHEQVVDMLLKAGANPDIQDKV